MISAFADCPQTMMLFCHRWSIANPVSRPCVIVCAECFGQLPLALVSDIEIPDREGQILLTLELMGRGWIIVKGGKPVCPTCRRGAKS